LELKRVKNWRKIGGKIAFLTPNFLLFSDHNINIVLIIKIINDNKSILELKKYI
jgi:hypothetical protein